MRQSRPSPRCVAAGLLLCAIVALPACGPIGASSVGLPVRDLAGTTWFLSDFDPKQPLDHEISLLTGGRVRHTNPRDSDPDDDLWRPTATGFEVVLNDGYATLTAEWVNSRTLEGTATNREGYTWRFRLTRLH